MADASATFDLKEIDAIGKLLDKAKLKPEVLRGFLDDAGSLIQRQSEDRFDDQTDPEGNEWKKLADKTIEYYQKKFPAALANRSILLGEGRLRDSMTYNVSGTDSVTVGATMIYAAVHQYGYKGIPARPYIGLSPDNMSELARFAELFLQERLP